MEKVKKSKM